MLVKEGIKQYLGIKVRMLHEFLQQQKRKTLVIGISGGIDSVVTLGILKELVTLFPGFYEVLPMLCPISDSQGTTEQKEAWTLGYEAITHFGFSENTYDLRGLSKAVRKELDIDSQYVQQQMDYWLRPMVFYKMAMDHENSIIVSTTNKSEWALGWFSQYLDIFGVHPIIDLYKSEVYLLADYFNVPETITKTPPKGGLANSETDEEALGFTYADFEDFIGYRTRDSEISKKIDKRIQESNFKRRRFNEHWIFQLTPTNKFTVPCPCCSYSIGDSTNNCVNCGGQTQFGQATGKSYINIHGQPCTHVYASQVIGRSHTKYTCKLCKYNFHIDSGG